MKFRKDKDKKRIRTETTENYISINDLGDQIAHTFDWSTWKPGRPDTSSLLRSPERLEKFLIGIDAEALYGISNATLRNVMRTFVADGLEKGETTTKIAKTIQNSGISSSCAFDIATTEVSRAMIEANLQSFVTQDVEQWEWTAGSPEGCICVELKGKIVNVGEEFAEGITQPPAHLNCSCGLKPTMPDMTGFENVNKSITGYEHL
jgi:hypothetical protein